jgi:hypothetical protein
MLTSEGSWGQGGPGEHPELPQVGSGAEFLLSINLSLLFANTLGYNLSVSRLTL